MNITRFKLDYLLLASLTAALLGYAIAGWGILDNQPHPWIAAFSNSVYVLINTIWWGVLFGIAAIALLGQLPRTLVMKALGTKAGIRGILRAVAAGVLLDLCSHGILMVAHKLYERGASAGQTIAFLVASPWNSLSLTIVLFSLVGLAWTLTFVGLSAVIAVFSGALFDKLVSHQVLPANPAAVHMIESDNTVTLQQEWLEFWNDLEITPILVGSMLMDGVKESRMTVRWIAFGVVLTGAIQASVSAEVLQNHFGPTLMGLSMTLIATTLIEVCSEGSTPIAADLLHRGQAAGNGFAFLMGGVATDFNEVMVLREATHSTKLALFLPLLVVPQVFVFGWLLNMVDLV